jgi:hypothetical protein
LASDGLWDVVPNEVSLLLYINNLSRGADIYALFSSQGLPE